MHKIRFSEIRSYFVNFKHVRTHIILCTHICKDMFVHVSVCDMIHVLLCKHLIYCMSTMDTHTKTYVQDVSKKCLRSYLFQKIRS